MASNCSKRFTWNKPVVPKQPAESFGLEHRLQVGATVKPSKHKIQAEYDGVKQKRRGKNGN